MTERQQQSRPQQRLVTAAESVQSAAPHSQKLQVDIGHRISLSDFALAYCNSNHIRHPASESDTRIYVQDETYLLCLKAVGLASYSNIARSSTLAAKARRCYIKAIRSTNAALSSSACVKDYTLLAVMALAFFESISGRDTYSLDAWQRHVQGMAALLTLRGSEQLRTANGRHLFLTAVGSLGAKCITLGIRLPSDIRDLMDKAALQYGSTEDPLWRISSTMSHVANLYGDVRCEGLANTPRIVAKATQLEKELAVIFAHTSPTWYVESKGKTRSKA